MSSPEVTSTTDLVERCMNGDAQAWREIVRRYARLVHSVPARHGLSAVEVEDVGQDTFLTLAQNLHQIQDPERLPAWLLTTARRLSWRALKRQQRESPAIGVDLTENDILPGTLLNTTPAPSMSELLAGWSRQETLTTGMARLSERCRNLLSLLFLDQDEPSYTQIGQRLHIAVGSIGPTRNRCLLQLRAILEGLGFDPSP